MITLTGLTKRFDGIGRAAVDALTLHIGQGETCVLIGPSGCGKTTTMRMINRMIEPDAGTIEVESRDVTHVDPVQLRRTIGYVIQQVGLFPHMTIGQNIATVPRLLQWDGRRIAARIDEMLALVRLPPDEFRNRFPSELSGGQRQRVGVARALAADPPVMLMDEPFGAIDPITRGELQDEFLRILREIRKTVVFVTHDMDEAMRMGTRIAIMRAGRLVQYDTPRAILAHPIDGFVEAFVGGDRALKRLALLDVTDYMTPSVADADGPAIPAQSTLHDALNVLLSDTADNVVVVDAEGVPLGSLTLDTLRSALREAS
ncbi:MAG TPA: ABC transporter ATP-binding protein [Casimicrobiaceae bacterium]|nr:ABC transporter ATP-binding protein [Casimicrobiaceae bacterium]